MHNIPHDKTLSLARTFPPSPDMQESVIAKKRTVEETQRNNKWSQQ